jgi:type II secretory pathway pseudopilin PulG
MERLRGRWWRLMEDDEGLGLVELVIAMFIMAVTLMALASVVLTSIGSLRDTRDREQATNAASAAIEQLRARDFRDLVHEASADLNALPDDVRAQLDVSGAHCAGNEPLVTDGAATVPAPLHQVGGDRDRFDVYTVITYLDEGTTSCSDGVDNRDLKRVVSLARWEDRGDVSWVRQETQMAAAGRGLPVPNFRLRPPEHTLVMPSSDAAEATRACLPHQLRNLGAADSYEWAMTDTNMGGAPLRASETRYETPGKSENKHWILEGYLELDPDDSAEPDPSKIMKDPEGTGRMHSDLVVGAGEEATFTVCYTAGSEDAEPFDLEITVFSRFDERRTGVSTHNVSVTGAATPLFLLDWNDFEAHDRCVTQGAHCNYEPYPMTAQLDGGEESHTRLGTADYSDPGESNWSTEIVPADDLSGIRLPRGDVGDEPSQSTAAWHYQFSDPRTLQAKPRLTIWVAPTSGLLSGEELTDEVTGEPAPVTTWLDVRLDGLGKNEKSVIWDGEGTAIQVPVEHTHAAWKKVDITLPGDDNIDFGVDEFLRLRVTCLDASDEDCNLAYDNTAYPSALRARLLL